MIRFEQAMRLIVLSSVALLLTVSASNAQSGYYIGPKAVNTCGISFDIKAGWKAEGQQTECDLIFYTNESQAAADRHNDSPQKITSDEGAKDNIKDYWALKECFSISVFHGAADKLFEEYEISDQPYNKNLSVEHNLETDQGRPITRGKFGNWDTFQFEFFVERMLRNLRPTDGVSGSSMNLFYDSEKHVGLAINVLDAKCVGSIQDGDDSDWKQIVQSIKFDESYTPKAFVNSQSFNN